MTWSSLLHSSTLITYLYPRKDQLAAKGDEILIRTARMSLYRRHLHYCEGVSSHFLVSILLFYLRVVFPSLVGIIMIDEEHFASLIEILNSHARPSYAALYTKRVSVQAPGWRAVQKIRSRMCRIFDRACAEFSMAHDARTLFWNAPKYAFSSALIGVHRLLMIEDENTMMKYYRTRWRQR